MSSPDLPKLWKPPQTSQNLYFQGWSNLSEKKSVKNIWLGDQLLLKNFLKISIFKILYFLKLCPILVGSVYNFGMSDNEKV